MSKLPMTQSISPCLLIRPIPKFHEGPLGFLLRLAEANSLSTYDLANLRILFSARDLYWHYILPPPQLAPELHQYINYVNDLQNTQPERIWNKRYSRFCSLCLSEDPFWRLSWEVTHFDVCPTHGTWLIDRCSKCGRTLNWKREALLTCSCGNDFRDEKPEYAPESSKELAIVMNNLLLGKELALTPGHYPMSDFQIHDLYKLIRYLGSYLDKNINAKPLKIINGGSIASSWPITTLAAELLSNWPFKFHEALDHFQETRTKNKVSLNKVFRTMYDYLYAGGLKDSHFDPVRAAFEQWVIANWRGGMSKRNRRITPEAQNQGQWVSSREARNQLAISLARIKYLVETGKIKGNETQSEHGRQFLTLQSSSLITVKQELQNEINLVDTIKLLGLCKVRMKKIIKLIFPSSSKINDQTHLPWKIPKSEVLRLLELGNFTTRVKSTQQNEIVLADILKYWRWDINDIAALIDATRCGKLSIKSLLVSKPGISGWIFNRDDLIKWQSSISSSDLNWITVPELAKNLGVKQQVAYWLIRNEYIHSQKQTGHKYRGTTVRKSSLSQFAKEYALCTEIAKKCGCTSRKIKSLLGELLIFPINGASGESCRQLIYRRTGELKCFIEKQVKDINANQFSSER